jgi:SAM-dependent methyltransferase
MSKKEEKRDFYTTLAGYYDKIYHHIDYTAQARFFSDIFSTYCKSHGKDLLDLACGTGTHADLLRELGFHPRGCDASEEMLRVARSKYPGIQFVHCDIRDLRVKGSYDLILCFFNSILYSCPLRNLVGTLGAIWRLLRPGGITIFDVVDKTVGIKASKEEYRYNEENLKILFAPQWQYVGRGEQLDLFVDFRLEEGSSVRVFNDHHILSAIDIPRLRSTMEEIGFTVQCLAREFDHVVRWNGTDKEAIFVGRRDR